MAPASPAQASNGYGAGELFQLLRDGRPRTRAELAQLTGLARSTVAGRIDELFSLGLVSPVGDPVSTGGRPSPQFALNPGGRAVIGVDVGASHVEVAVADLSGAILERRGEPLAVTEGPERILNWVVDTGKALMKSLGREQTAAVGLGIGLPGTVEYSTGRPINPLIMPGWDRFDVPGWVRGRWDLPVLVDNDVNILALGERDVAWPEVEYLVFVKVATGIGAGVISGSRLQRGAQGIAGDIGHVQIPRGAGVPCHCGNEGCLVAMASGPAIARALREKGFDVTDGHDVVAMVKRGEVEAILAVRQAGRDIGEVLTACVSLVNPSVIAIGGSMARAGEYLIAGIREVVYARSMPLATEHLAVVQSQAGPDAALRGASMLAIHHALSPASIDAMV